MPNSKKEGLIFTTMMCFLMVFGMSCYNLVIHHSFALSQLVIGLIPGFIVAFALDTLVVGTIAKKIAFKLPIDHDNFLQLVLTISSLMIIGMVTCMSLFGLVMEGGLAQLGWAAYRQAWLLNIIVALPYQLLIVGPLSRHVLKKIQQRA